MSIRLGGDLDTVAVPEFRRVPTEAMSESPQTLSVDLTAVSFVSLSAMGALIRVRDTLQHGGAGLDVRGRVRSHRLLVERADRGDRLARHS
jgi:anti-anti-sigma factor